MTQLLEKAFVKASHELSEAEQNILAKAMLQGMRNLIELVEQQTPEKPNIEVSETAILSEAALADWKRPEEEEAWQHLQ